MAVVELFDGSGTPVVLRVGSGPAGTDALTAFAIAVASVPKVRVSTVARLDSSSLIRVGGVTEATRVQVEAALDAALADQGIGARAEIVPADRLDHIDTAPNAVVLRLFPPPGERLRRAWIDEAIGWVAPVDGGSLVIRLLGHDFTAPAVDATRVLDDAVASRSWVDVVQGDPTQVLRTASATFGTTPHLALAAGGPGCTDDVLVAWADELVTVARRHAPSAGYACISIEPSFADIGFGLPDDGWLGEGGADPNVVVARLGTSCIPDVFSYQLLTSDHAARLMPGTDASDPPVGQPLGGDRFEVRIGEFRAWLPGSRTRTHLRADAWNEFEPLLVLASDLDSHVNGPGHSVDVPAGITITALPQPERGSAVSLLQLAAWMAGTEHSDAPAIVPTAAATYVRSLAAALDNETRAGLRPAAVALARGDALDDDEAAQAVVVWLVATAREWIHAAGLDDAGRDVTVDDLGDHTAIVHAAQSLAAAIVAGTQRADLAASIVGPASDLLEQITWEVWERVADRTGTSAAVAAAVTGVDTDITDATEDRVIALSRSPDARTLADMTGIAFSDEVWSAATRELAVGAWRDAWKVLDDHVGFHWAFSARKAVRRALETDPAIAGDRDLVDEAIEAAEHVAVSALARLFLSGRTHDDPLGATLEEVRASPGAARWSAALAGARDAVTTELFDESWAEAAAWLAAEMRPRSRRLQFAVLAAVAREAAGAATRSLAAQAAAPALGRGVGYALAGAAARSEVDPIADRQTASAIELLHTLAGTPESLRGG